MPNITSHLLFVPFLCLFASAFPMMANADETPDSAATQNEYEKLMSSAECVSQGMFDVLWDAKAEEYYLQMPLDLMGRDMLVVNKLVRVPAELNDAGVNRGLEYDNKMVRWEYDAAGKKVYLRGQRPLPDSPARDAITLSVRNNYISPIIAAFKAEAVNADSTAVIIKATSLFNGKETSINNVFADTNIGTPVKSDLSRIIDVKAFDNNIYSRAELTTRVDEAGGTIFVTVETGTTLALLPEQPMARRYASPQIGYFTVSGLNYADEQQRVARKHYITRWRLEPKDDEVDDYLVGRLVEPKKPIVFYIDESTPPQWRPYIKKGVEDWQKAFEMAGFKNAILAYEMPSDSIAETLDDINYSTVVYAASPKSNAMGPSIIDPRSGEILEADIMWWHNVLDMIHDWIIVQTGASDERVTTSRIPEEVLGDAMRFVACHEVGHSLGLRHNMMGSNAIPVDSLRSPSFTERFQSTSSSIMDYARFNYIAQPGDGVKTFSPSIGPYDLLAIEYGYRWFSPVEDPENDYRKLHNMLPAYDNPLYAYSEAQSMREVVDPRAQSEDLGNNSMEASRYGIANLKRIVPDIVNWVATGEPGQTYDDASRLYQAVVAQWNQYMYHILGNIGGMYLDNTTIFDGKPTYRYVEGKRQREAVKMLIDEAFVNTAWLFEPELLQYTYVVRNTPLGRQEQSPSLLLKNTQSYLIWDLLTNERLMRMLDHESDTDGKTFTAVELFDMLHQAIFETTYKRKRLTVREREMQKNYIDALITASGERQGIKEGVALGLTDCSADPQLAFQEHLLLDSHPFCSDRCGMGERSPNKRTIIHGGSLSTRISDAISIKRGELMRIRKMLKGHRNISDRATKYHYDDLLMRINTALGFQQEG